MSKSNLFIDFLEWESFTWPKKFSNVTCEKGIYNLPRDSIIEIWRDNEYKLTGKISGVTDDKNNLEYNQNIDKLKSGTILSSETINGTDIFNIYRYKINGASIDGISTTPISPPPNMKISFDAEIILSSFVEKIDNNGQDADTLLEFYLLGKTHFLYPRKTARSKNIIYTKRRGKIDIKDTPENTLSRLYGTGTDHMLIHTEEFDFIIQKVEDDLLPDWANGIQIEYSLDKNMIPLEVVRKKISEIISFIFGTQLLKIGESWLKDNWVIRRIAQSPIGGNAISRCSRISWPPINLYGFTNSNVAENFLTHVLPQYFKLYDNLNFGDVMWKYWLAHELPIGANLPILSSAFEALAESYIKCYGLVIKYTEAQKKEYRKLIAEDINSLSLKLDSYDFRKNILNKIENPFSLGIGEKIALFCDALKLNITNISIENKALIARNAMAHSTINTDNDSIAKYLKLTHAYMSFFNRVILRILNYDGTYVDYSVLGYPSKNMNDNLG